MPQKRNYTRRKRRKTKYNQPLIIFLTIIVLLGAGILGFNRYREYKEETRTEQVETEHNAFVKKVAPYAIYLGKEYGVLPSITIAQAILESDWGRSTLATDYNNYFGVKGTDPSNTKVLQTKEYTNGQWVTINGRFRVYSDYRESMKDHAQLLVNGTSWNSQQYQQVIHSKDYIEAAVALQTDGYATDPGYTTKIIRVIQKYNLKKYDEGIK